MGLFSKKEEHLAGHQHQGHGHGDGCCQSGNHAKHDHAGHHHGDGDGCCQSGKHEGHHHAGHGHGHHADNNTTVVLQVSGMSCSHCKQSIEKALNKIDGVCHADVNVAGGNVTVVYDPSKTNTTAFSVAIADAGYEVKA